MRLKLAWYTSGEIMSEALIIEVAVKATLVLDGSEDAPC